MSEKEIKTMEKNEELKSTFWSIKSYRLLITLNFGLMVMANSLLGNSIVSFAVVCMVNSTKTDNNQNDLQSQENSSCSSSQSNDDYHGTFNWNTFEQGFIFSAFQISGLLAALPSGWIADRYDPKTMVSVSIFMMTVLTLVSPITADKGGVVGFAILRFVIGFFGLTPILTGIGSISARWIPPLERSTVIALYTGGMSLSGVISSPMNAYLCHAYNWESLFYVNAAFGIVAFIVWLIFVSNTPEHNRFISTDEKMYIEKCLSDQSLGNRKEVTQKVPWLKMMTSPALIVVFLCNFSGGLLASVMGNYIPTYFKDALSISLLSNGLYSALLSAVPCVSTLITAIAADMLKQKTKLSPTWICKIFNTSSNFVAAVFLIACSFMNCSTVGWAVTFLCLSAVGFGGTSAGFFTSAVSIAPPFAGLIMSYMQVAGQIGPIVSPYIVSALTPNGTTQEWQNVFFVVAALIVLTGLLFLVFGSASIQKWATPDKIANMDIVVIGSPENGVQNKNNGDIKNCGSDLPYPGA